MSALYRWRRAGDWTYVHRVVPELGDGPCVAYAGPAGTLWRVVLDPGPRRRVLAAPDRRRALEHLEARFGDGDPAWLGREAAA